MYLYNNDMDFIFAFCKSCWEYKKIIFAKLIDFEKDKILNGKCIECNNKMNFDIQKIRNIYYQKLN